MTTTRKHRTLLALSRSLQHMAGSVEFMEHFDRTGKKEYLVDAIFHQIVALHYETEAVRLGLESKEMHKFMCQLYGR